MSIFKNSRVSLITQLACHATRQPAASNSIVLNTVMNACSEILRKKTGRILLPRGVFRVFKQWWMPAVYVTLLACHPTGFPHKKVVHRLAFINRCVNVNMRCRINTSGGIKQFIIPQSQSISAVVWTRERTSSSPKSSSHHEVRKSHCRHSFGHRRLHTSRWRK